MMIKTAKQIRDEVLAMRPGYLIDRFLDWIEELSSAVVPAQVEGVALIEIRTERLRDR